MQLSSAAVKQTVSSDFTPVLTEEKDAPYKNGW